jgi:hypothetical protein
VEHAKHPYAKKGTVMHPYNPSTQKLRQEDHKFELGQIARLCLKTHTQKTPQISTGCRWLMPVIPDTQEA